MITARANGRLSLVCAGLTPRRRWPSIAPSHPFCDALAFAVAAIKAMAVDFLVDGTIEKSTRLGAGGSVVGIGNACAPAHITHIRVGRQRCWPGMSSRGAIPSRLREVRGWRSGALPVRLRAMGSQWGSFRARGRGADGRMHGVAAHLSLHCGCSDSLTGSILPHPGQRKSFEAISSRGLTSPRAEAGRDSTRSPAAS